MNKAIRSLLSILLILTAPFSAWAGTPLGNPEAIPAPPPAVSINPGANVGQASQNGGAGSNNAAGAALIASAIPMLANPPTMPIGMMLLAMGLLALAQGGADSGAAGQSGNTAAQSYAGTGTTGTGATGSSGTSALTPGADGGMAGAFASPAGQQAIAAITAAGGSVSDQGITMPDGSFKSWGAFSSASSMKANGMDPTEAMKVVGDVEKKLGVNGKATSIASDSSGGGSIRGPSGDDKFTPFNPFKLSADAKAKLIAGKTVNYKNDPIGVAMDDIFAMIHRAYTRKTAADTFIVENSAAPGSAARDPASVAPPVKAEQASSKVKGK